MRKRDDEIRLGESVVVSRGGTRERGTLVAYETSPVGREVRVRLDGETGAVLVPVFMVSRVPRESRWWWPEALALRVAIVGVVATLLAAVPSYFTWLSAGSSGDRQPSSAGSAVANASAGRGKVSGTGSSTRPTPQPYQPRPNAGASCSELERTSFDGSGGRPVFVDSPGQLEGGEGGVKGRITPNGSYTQLVKAVRGDELEISIRLFDTDYSSVQDAVVIARMMPFGNGCWRITGTAHYPTANGADPMFGPFFVVLPPGSSRLTFLPGSTKLLDQHDKHLAQLPDGILGSGVAVPFEIPPASLDIYYINFYVRVA